MFAVHVVNRLEEAASNYDSQYVALLKLLREKSDQAGGMVRFLTFRLDYNAEELQRAAAVADAIGATDTSSTANANASKASNVQYGPDGRKVSSPNTSSASVATFLSARTSGGATATAPSGRRSLASEFGAPDTGAPTSRAQRFTTR